MWKRFLSSCGSVESCRLHERFAALRSGGAALRIDLEQQLSTQELLALLQAAPIWPTIEAAMNSSGGCKRRCTHGGSHSCSCETPPPTTFEQHRG